MNTTQQTEPETSPSNNPERTCWKRWVNQLEAKYGRAYSNEWTFNMYIQMTPDLRNKISMGGA